MDKKNKVYSFFKDKLWCDLKNDKERVEFLECGRAHDTGIIAPSMEKEIIAVFKYRIKHRHTQRGRK